MELGLRLVESAFFDSGLTKICSALYSVEMDIRHCLLHLFIDNSSIINEKFAFLNKNHKKMKFS